MNYKLALLALCLIYITPLFLTEEIPVFGEAFKDRYKDCFREAPDLIKDYGYPFEEYNVTTEDGYILLVHRIPYNESCGQKKGTVIIVHSLCETSTIWLIQGPGRALPFLLADECYDVWLPNLRGNYYSRYHTTLSNKDCKFWDFTITEVAIYDLPAVIDHVKTNTNDDKIFYFGLAYGNTVFYVLMAKKPEYNNYIRLHVSFGPTASLAHADLLYWREGFFAAALLNPELKLLGVNELLPKTQLNYELAEKMCQPGEPTQIFCIAALQMIAGYDYEQVNKTLFPVYVCHFPAGMGRNLPSHYGQSIKYGDLMHFDYGSLENLKVYGSLTPPGYQWENIKCPVIFYQGDRDTSTTPQDSKILYDKIPGGVEYKIIKEFNHQDFVVGVSSTERAYKPIIETMKNY